MKTTAGFVLAILAIIAMVLATGRLASDRVEATARVRRTLDVLQQIQSLRSTVQDAETGQRGYLLTLANDYLQPFESARGRVRAELASLRALVADSAEQTRRMDQLSGAVEGKLQELERTLSTARSGRVAEAVVMVRAGQGKDWMDAIRRVLSDMETSERQALGEREAISQRAFSRLLLGLYGGGALLLLLTVGAAMLTRRDFRQLTEHEAQQQRLVEYQQKLIGMTSHDLRNPLMAISVSSAHLLKNDALPEKARSAAERITRASSRAVAVASTMADYTHARLGSGLPIDPRPARLLDVVERVTDELRSSDPGARIEVSSAGEPSGIFDPDRLAQVVSNLVSNALKYGEVNRPVTVVTRSSPGDRLAIEVHNEGRPIPPADQRALFEPFKRGIQDSREGKERGLGLGLYIVQEIAHAHGGTVRVQSREGEGTCFTVEIPRHAPAQRPQAVGSEQGSESREEATEAGAVRLVPVLEG